VDGEAPVPQRDRVSGVLLSQIDLDAPVTVLWGVGSERSLQLERLGIRTLTDFLLHRPRRYEDRRVFRAIRDITEKGLVTVRGRVVAQGVKTFRGGARSVFELILDDGTGRLHCRWWNMPYLEGHFSVGLELLVVGRVMELKPRSMNHPETEVVEEGDEPSVHMGRIVPVYPLTEGISQRWMRGRMWSLVEHVAPRVEEPFPEVNSGGLPTRAEAIRALHFPSDPEEADLGRRRLAFDEFVGLQREIQGRRRRLLAAARGLPCGGDNRLIKPFLGRLGFRLTEAQSGVLREIRQDMGGASPMRRLVQGDVGSGKTVVAAAAALMAIESGYSVALMVPTEILAGQHEGRFREWFRPLGIPVECRTGSIDTTVSCGDDRVGLTIGTHALLESGFVPRNLGLVIIDEQHKFGVTQREELVRKGRYPHLLVMTATPIPRTLALTLYGDLDVSVMGQSPPGRGRIRTYVRGRDKLPKVWEFVRGELSAGRQAYVVFSRVDDDGGGDVKAVTRELTGLKKVLEPYEVAMLHGRMDGEEKERVMDGFRSGRTHVLLATSVIEVGVDVPNATVMVIENAEQFGLAQLHQLRGRIGRGGHAATCVLVMAKDSDEIRRRLKVLEESADGFAIAEADLRLRGPGEMLGQAQSGLPPFRFADLAGDRELLEFARSAVSAAWNSHEQEPGT
jgi:ATP-dependent DNA helicase RecG